MTDPSFGSAALDLHGHWRPGSGAWLGASVGQESGTFRARRVGRRIAARFGRWRGRVGAGWFLRNTTSPGANPTREGPPAGSRCEAYRRDAVIGRQEQRITARGGRGEAAGVADRQGRQPGPRRGVESDQGAVLLEGPHGAPDDER